MIIACPACGTRYAIPDSAIGLEGRTVRCAKCRHSWFQDGPEPALHDAEAQATTQVRSAATAQAPAQAPTTPTAPPPQASVTPPAPPPAAPSPAPPPVAAPSRPAIVTPPRTPAAAPPPDTSNAAMAATTQPAIEDAPLPAPPAPPRKSGYYDDTGNVPYADEVPSRFDHAPPFRARRNWTRIATWAAGAFAIVTLALTGAVAWGGLPDWVPIPRATFQHAQPDLKLDFPRNRQDRKPLPDGTEFFSVSGTISNIGRETRSVPSLLVVLRNPRETIVYEKEIVPSKRQLAPGETITVNEALTDIPRAAASAEIGWKPE